MRGTGNTAVVMALLVLVVTILLMIITCFQSGDYVCPGTGAKKGKTQGL
jgi:hypothetical protein